MFGALAKLFGKRLEEIDHNEFVARLPDDFSFMLDDVDVTLGLAQVFIAYRVRLAEARERGIADQDARQQLGPAPWDVLNETFASAGFPFKVRSPIGTKLLDWYDLTLDDLEHGTTLRPKDLSSGEKTLLGLVLWLYNSRHHGRFPKLLLLDEPDAHLHPSMTRHFIDVIKDVLVRRYQVRVILTTHSPSTVALAPEDALFEMRRSTPRIVKSPGKADTVGILTAGLVVVSAGSRHVLVEDEDDVRFYEMLRDVLTDYGPTRDPRSLKPAPTVTFLPASVGTGKGKIAGGRSVVLDWLNKFDAPPFTELVRGVIDRDQGNQPTERLGVLGRYSIENYLLDPFVVYAVLLDQGTAPDVPQVRIARGQEHLLRTSSNDELRAIVEVIRFGVEPLLGQLTRDDGQLDEVTFTNGSKVAYPRWLISRRGHDLLPVFQRVYGGPGIISPSRLRQAFARVRLVPSELADVMHHVQR